MSSVLSQRGSEILQLVSKTIMDFVDGVHFFQEKANLNRIQTANSHPGLMFPKKQQMSKKVHFGI